MTSRTSSRIRGCLLGLALGDAFGYALRDAESVPLLFGPDVPFDDGGGAASSDNTQLAAYTVDGLAEALDWANQGVAADETACLWLAYLRWMAAQGLRLPTSAPVPPPRWLDRQEVMRRKRAMHPATVAALASGEMGSSARPLNPDARDAGALARSAPFGLVPGLPAATVAKLSADGAALTHGHPVVRQASAAFSLLLQALAGADTDVAGAAERAKSELETMPAAEPKVLQALDAAVEVAGSRGTAARAADLPEDFPRGEDAEQTLAVGLYAALVTDDGEPQEHFRRAVSLAAAAGTDRAAAGAVAGALVGALRGEAALPAEWLSALDATEVMAAMADALVKVSGAEG